MRRMSFKPYPQPSVQETVLTPCAPAMRPSIYSELSAVAIPAAGFVQGLGSPGKNIQPTRISDSRISAPLSPGTWGFSMAQQCPDRHEAEAQSLKGSALEGLSLASPQAPHRIPRLHE